MHTVATHVSVIPYNITSNCSVRFTNDILSLPTKVPLLPEGVHVADIVAEARGVPAPEGQHLLTQFRHKLLSLRPSASPD
ncbi:hypothetical protein EVAR_16169_1 [Eumeta japonica]|uniref:Uncharacterized protein n=1 Tax=Eumeta variegata TaxID=151549 RepID=A0A4C1WC68_EUMVA|nr:hypothetical protein EVAR_16169_1 [Eumeta japonica]